MRWRLRESARMYHLPHREAVYRIGVEDSGNPRGLPDEQLYKSLLTVKRMCEAAKVRLVDSILCPCDSVYPCSHCPLCHVAAFTGMVRSQECVYLLSCQPRVVIVVRHGVMHSAVTTWLFAQAEMFLTSVQLGSTPGTKVATVVVRDKLEAPPPRQEVKGW